LFFKYNTGAGAGAIINTNDSSNNSIISNCTFIGNIATSNSSNGAGGVSNSSSRLKISNCLFSRDTGYIGGGVFVNNASVIPITNCVFSHNVSTFGGGGVRISSPSTAIITNCTFYKNAGASSQGGGVNHPSSGVTTKIYNSIFWGNTKGGDSTIGGSDLNGPALVSNCLLQLQDKSHYNTYDTLSDNNIFLTNPAFVNPLGAGDTSSNESLRLKTNSPCTDAGDNLLLPPNDTVDIAGAPRVQGDFVDMGAYETSYTATPDGLHLSFSNTFVCPVSPTVLPSYVDIPLIVSNFNSLISLQGSITWDTSVLKFNSISSMAPNIGLSSNNFNSSTSGNLLFSWYDNDLTGKSVPDSSALFTIRFNIDPGGFGKRAVLKIGNYPISLEAVQYPQKIWQFRIKALQLVYRQHL